MHLFDHSTCSIYGDLRTQGKKIYRMQLRPQNMTDVAGKYARTVKGPLNTVAPVENAHFSLSGGPTRTFTIRSGRRYLLAASLTSSGDTFSTRSGQTLKRPGASP